MFSGIIEELGRVRSLDKRQPVSILFISAAGLSRGSGVGQSISVNGACLTVIEIEKDVLCFEVMEETLKRTNLGLLRQADKVNLEQALRINDRLNGHFVSGHIDGTGIISKKQRKGKDTVVQIKTHSRILRYIALKGSVTVDGVSLTVSEQRASSFSVNLTPYTLKNTTLGLKREKDIVNIEADILARYIDRLLQTPLNTPASTSQISSSLLKKHGFI